MAVAKLLFVVTFVRFKSQFNIQFNFYSLRFIYSLIVIPAIYIFAMIVDLTYIRFEFELL